MTTFPSAAGTGSVPVAASQRNNTNNAAALQLLSAAMVSSLRPLRLSTTRLLWLPTQLPPTLTLFQLLPLPARLQPAFSPMARGWRGGFYVVIPPAPLLPIAEPIWYCITKGRYVGVTLNNALALAAVVGVSGGNMKGYKTQALALAAFNELLQYHMVAVIP
ncbi:hypothetical protein B0H11DRAFT_2257619 [Mycena galericulata]|nr:hypothetical protein B0H11DRAFT_2257619 [Mycena galericulata]